MLTIAGGILLAVAIAILIPWIITGLGWCYIFTVALLRGAFRRDATRL
jgi:hypothetical protein